MTSSFLHFIASLRLQTPAKIFMEQVKGLSFHNTEYVLIPVT